MATKKKKLTIDQILQAVAELTVLELSELVSAVEDKFNVSATPVMTAQPVEVAVETEKEEEQTEFDVFLKDFGMKKIMVIKALRGLTNLSLMESKAAVERGGKLTDDLALTKDEAEQFAAKLAEEGADVEVK